MKMAFVFKIVTDKFGSIIVCPVKINYNQTTFNSRSSDGRGCEVAPRPKGLKAA